LVSLFLYGGPATPIVPDLRESGGIAYSSLLTI